MSTTRPEWLETLVLPTTDAARVARALDGLVAEGETLVALAAPVTSAGALALRFVDRWGHPAAMDYLAAASALSAGGEAVGLARIHPANDARAWLRFEGGAQVSAIGRAEELYLPHDDEGFPELSVAPVALADMPEGPPAGWRRLRTCMDLGMKGLSSCRFTPVTRAFDRLSAGDGVDGARAFALIWESRRLRPAQEIPWQRLFSR